MKAKHIIATTSAAIIAGSVFYYLARRKNNASQAIKPSSSVKPGEERIQEMRVAPNKGKPIADA